MLGITPDQQQALNEISESMNTTFYGRTWPDEYNHFSRLWEYFNSIYDVLYPRRPGQPEWDQIALFAIVYQIRNNLFHGSKNEVTGRDFQRNLFLVNISSEIMEIVLQEIDKLIGIAHPAKP